eukprot:TRINITY_DN21072_c0_g1_i2.p1 TRINITY_DN21072_c0_g1~~TRINITY_DN21072_c0_g1_i2.p1  ORF type:complete len:382 (+),score=67.38 TRINITY_DN21072_c0_g1_i2:78-1223(+)
MSSRWDVCGYSFALGAGAGAAVVLLLSELRIRAARTQTDCRMTRREPDAAIASYDGLEVYELKGQFYQVLGHAWDHEVKQFKVIYRPLYTCFRKPGSFEAHQLACSHFSRWESKFKKVMDIAREVSSEAKAFLLPGPFVKADPFWPFPVRTSELGIPAQLSASPQRSHDVLRLEHVIGEVNAFIDTVHARLLEAGLNALQRGYEMDHVCYRCETVAEYRAVVAALVPRLGSLMVEGMIGGRPIATIRLHEPAQHAGYSVTCIEVPCPKAGTEYPSGLEHAELVIGTPEDGFQKKEALTRFIADCQSKKLPLAERFDKRAMAKDLNADVSVSFDAAGDAQEPRNKFCVKFHQRPLYEVVEEEIKMNAVIPVPPGYFETPARL